MNFIKLTLATDNSTIFVNPDHIGHFYSETETAPFGTISNKTATRVSTITHNNGGFQVKETPAQIIKLIEKISK